MNVYEKIIVALAIILLLLAILNVAYWIGKKLNDFDDEN